MINEETLSRLCESAVEDCKLTTKELYSYGFNLKDLTKLIKQEKLIRITRGHYAFISVMDLCQHGKGLLRKKEFEKALKCFEKCLELDPNHYDACFQLFLNSIQNLDYATAFKYFEGMNTTDNPYYKAENNLYLYLLSLVTEVPKKYKGYVKSLRMEDVAIDFKDKRYVKIMLQNRIRDCIMCGKFNYAIFYLKNLNLKVTPQNIIIGALLDQVLVEEEQKKNILLYFATKKKFDEIIKYIKEKSEKQRLNMFDKSVLKLAQQLINLQNGQMLPPKTIFKTKSCFTAINNNDYELALEFAYKNCVDKRKDSDGNIFCIMLTEICRMTKKSTKEPIDSLTTNANPEKPNSANEKGSLFQKNLSTGISYLTIIKQLIRSDLNGALKTLKDYMTMINRKDYEFLIIDLIRLSVLEKDVTFTKPMAALANICKEDFEFDNTGYIQEFYFALSQNKFEVARVYLDIITKFNILGVQCSFIDILQQVLKNSEEMFRKNYNINMPAEEQKENKNDSLKPQTTQRQIKEIEEKDKERKFAQSKDDTYGIENLDEITAYILESGLNVETACEQLGLTKEQIDTIRLIYAIECYTQGNYKKGDQFLQAVEKSKNKTEFNLRLLNEVKRNKRFYIIKAEKNEEPLTLSLQIVGNKKNV